MNVWGSSGTPTLPRYYDSDREKWVTPEAKPGDWLPIADRPGWVQIGMDPQTFAQSAGGAQATGATYDPQYGWIAPEATVAPIISNLNAQQTQKGSQGFWNGAGPWALALGAFGGVAGASMLGGGLDGYSGINSAADLAGGAPGATGGLPANYWGMTAEGPGAVTDASAANAGTQGTNLSQFLNPNPASLGASAVGQAAGGFGSSADMASLPTGQALGQNMNGFTNGSTGNIAAGADGISPYITNGAGAAAGGTTLASLLGLGNGSLSGMQGLGLATSALSGLGQAYAANSAANTAANAQNNATNAQLGIFNTINSQQAPYRQAGYTALSSLLGGLGQGPTSGGVSSGQFAHQFDANDLKTNLAPNYDFQLQQGLGATRNAMNATGGFAGNTLKAVNDYAQNFAGNAYQNAFNNYNANQTNIFNRLSNIAGLGQTSLANSGSAASSMAPGIANTMVGAGNAQSAGQVGTANALANAGNSALGWYSLPQILNMGSANG